jgi:RNA polymerase sigma-70 factor, ECF subfamily
LRPDEEAEFAALVERQWRFAYRVAWSMLRNSYDAEDAAQEAFLKILRARAWRGLRDERAFVARAAWRTAVDRLRERAAHARAEQISGDAGQDPIADRIFPASQDPDAEELAIVANWEAAVHRLIDSLPEELRQPLALSVEMNSREIAAAMGIPEGTVRTRLLRARHVLREKMAAMEERSVARERSKYFVR